MAKKRKSRATEPTQPEPQSQPEPTHEQTNQPLQIEQEENPNIQIEQQPIENESESNESNQNDDVMDSETKTEQIATNGVEKQIISDDDSELEQEPIEQILEPFTKDQLTLLLKQSLTKHPDLISTINNLADSDPAHRKIFVHGLGWDAGSQTVTSVFGKYGQIEDCKVVKDKISGKSKGYAFILFKHRLGARKALVEPNKLIDGRMSSCQLASAGPVTTNVNLNAGVNLNASVNVSSGSSVASEYTMRKIFVSNVSAEIEPNKLLEYFREFGEVEEGPMGLDKNTGKFRGFCLFVYKRVESAKKALEEPHKSFQGTMLHCQKAVDGPKHGKGGTGSGGFTHQAKKGKFSGGFSGGGGHLMAPSGGSNMTPMGFNPGVVGQAVAALLAGQGAGLGIGNFLGGMGPGGPQMMNNAGYGGPGGYGGQPGMQGGYGGEQQMGQPGVRPHQGGAPYMGHGR